MTAYDWRLWLGLDSFHGELAKVDFPRGRKPTTSRIDLHRSRGRPGKDKILGGRYRNPILAFCYNKILSSLRNIISNSMKLH